MIPVEGHKNLYRDENSNAIINTDHAAYNDYINTRRINSDKQAEFCLLYTSPSPRDRYGSRMPSSA